MIYDGVRCHCQLSVTFVCMADATLMRLQDAECSVYACTFFQNSISYVSMRASIEMLSVHTLAFEHHHISRIADARDQQVTVRVAQKLLSRNGHPAVVDS